MPMHGLADDGRASPEGALMVPAHSLLPLINPGWILLAAQFEARVEVAKDGFGTNVSIIHAAPEASPAGVSRSRTCP